MHSIYAYYATSRFVLFVFILPACVLFFVCSFWNFGIFRLSFVSIDCRFITVFAIASCHDRMTLFRSRYSSERFPFFLHSFLFLLLNNIECMMWSVIFEIDKSLWCEGRVWHTKERQRNNRNKKFKTHFTSNHVCECVCFHIVNWVCLSPFLSAALSFHLAELMI